MDMTGKPLNGLITHALTPSAIEQLRAIKRHPIPRQEVNPGHYDRFVRGDLVATTMLPSPYKTVKGDVAHLILTDAGHAAIATADAQAALKAEKKNKIGNR